MPLWAWIVASFFVGLWVGGTLGYVLAGLLFRASEEVDRIDAEIRERLGI